MATMELSTEDLQERVDGGDIILLDFWAEWCAPCHQFAPIYEEASERHPDVTFGRVDTEAEPQLAGQLGIQSIPTLVAIRDGVVLFKESGVLPGEAIDQVLEQIRELDMDQIHSEIAEQEAAESPADGGDPDGDPEQHGQAR